MTFIITGILKLVLQVSNIITRSVVLSGVQPSLMVSYLANVEGANYGCSILKISGALKHTGRSITDVKLFAIHL